MTRGLLLGIGSDGDGGFETGEYFGFGALGCGNIHAKARLIRLTP